MQYFGERFGAKELPFPGIVKKISYKAFSSVYPERKPDPKGDRFSKWEKAMAVSILFYKLQLSATWLDLYIISTFSVHFYYKLILQQCNGYLKKLCEKFGEDGVVIPKEAGNFRGNLDEYIRQMFPKVSYEDI